MVTRLNFPHLCNRGCLPATNLKTWHIRNITDVGPLTFIFPYKKTSHGHGYPVSYLCRPVQIQKTGILSPKTFIFPTYIRDVSARKFGCLGNIILSVNFSARSILTFGKTDVNENGVFLTNTRLFSSQRKGKGRHVKSYEELLNYDSSDEDGRKDEEYIDDDYDPDDCSDDDVKSKTWKDLKYHLSGFRADQILATGLGISRNKVDDAFLSGKLRLNGEKLTKKSKRIEVGDTLDIVKGKHSAEDKIEVMRVVFRKLEDEKSRKDKYIVILRRWKHLVIPKPSKS